MDKAAVADPQRAVEALAVEAVGVDVAKEIAGGDRCVQAVDRDHDPAEASIDRDGHQVGGGDRRTGQISGCSVLREGGGGREGHEQQSDSCEHGSILIALCRVRERVG